MFKLKKILLIALCSTNVFASDSDNVASSSANAIQRVSYNPKVYIPLLLRGLFKEPQITTLHGNKPSFFEKISEIEKSFEIRESIFNIIKKQFDKFNGDFELEVAKAILDGAYVKIGSIESSSVAFTLFIFYLKHECAFNEDLNADLINSITEFEVKHLIEYPETLIADDPRYFDGLEEDLRNLIADALQDMGRDFDAQKILDYDQNEREVFGYVMCLMINALKREFYEMFPKEAEIVLGKVELEDKYEGYLEAKKIKKQAKKQRQKAKKQTKEEGSACASSGAVAVSDEEIITLQMDEDIKDNILPSTSARADIATYECPSVAISEDKLNEQENDFLPHLPKRINQLMRMAKSCLEKLNVIEKIPENKGIRIALADKFNEYSYIAEKYSNLIAANNINSLSSEEKRVLINDIRTNVSINLDEVD